MEEKPSKEVVDKEKTEEKKKRKVLLKIFLVITGILLLMSLFVTADVLVGNGKIIGNVVSSVSESTMKLVCKQQAYQDTEYETVQVPYQDTEYYTQTENGANCDSDSDCSCLHKSWFGLGACDSCTCTRAKTVTKYRTEQKQNEVTKLKDVCIKVKKWDSPNYNDNWLDYPELYDKDGNRIK